MKFGVTDSSFSVFNTSMVVLCMVTMTVNFGLVFDALYISTEPLNQLK